MIKLKKKLKIKISSRQLMLTESVDFFSFSDDDEEVSKPGFLSLLFFPKILYLFCFVFFITKFFSSSIFMNLINTQYQKDEKSGLIKRKK